ncbi:MAG: hypothetical protein LBV67_06915 [Streptococcaceae bacterium]|jgi:hypothetical protein|nr:hypothetical protein [Streptococcaceae bacterium]
MSSLHWYILAQVLGIITIIFEFTSYQIKDKVKYFLITGIGSFFWMFMFLAIGLSTGMSTQISLIVAGAYSTIRNLTFHVTFKKDTVQSNEFGLIFLLFMIAFALIGGVVAVISAPSEVRWIHAIGLIAALGFVIGQYLPGDHYVRITVVFYALAIMLTQTPLNILEGDFRWNVMGLLIELAKIISVVLFYIRYKKNPQRTGLQLSGV